MDVKRINEVAPEVLFDLVKVHASETFCRQAGTTPRKGDAWQSVAAGLSRARYEQARIAAQRAAARAAEDPPDVASAAETQVTEEDVRRQLVHIYMGGPDGFAEAIIAAKLKDDLSIFKRMGYRTVEEAFRHWTWYLLCLTCKADDICSPDGRKWSEKAQRDGLACLPLDSVDLQVLAAAFQTQITVTHLNKESWRFRPPQHMINQGQPCIAIHLVRHEHLWAPLLEPTPPELQHRSLEGCVVELGNLDCGALKAASFKTAVVLQYDREIDAYIVCKDQVKFPVQRSEINQVLFYEGADKDENSGLRRNWRSPEALWHIPEASLQFQILLDLVRECGRKKVGEQHSSLAGRANTARPAEATVSSSSRAPLPSRNTSGEAVPEMHTSTAPTIEVQQMPSAATTCRRCRIEVERDLQAGREIRAFAIAGWNPRSNAEMQVRKDDMIVLSSLQREFVLCRHVSSEAVKADPRWCPIDNFTVWDVKFRFTPPPEWQDRTRYLPLQVGQSLWVTTSFGGDWNGWAHAQLLSPAHGYAQGAIREGIVPLDFVEPKILVSS